MYVCVCIPKVHQQTWSLVCCVSPVLQQPVILVAIGTIPDDQHCMAQGRSGAVR